jgi:hypothetical protein
VGLEEDLTLVVDHRAPGQGLDLRHQMVTHLVLVGLAELPHEVAVAAVEHRLLRDGDAATHHDEEEVVEHVGLRLQGPLPEGVLEGAHDLGGDLGQQALFRARARAELVRHPRGW